MTLILRAATVADAPFVQRIVFDSLRSFGIEPEPEGLDADVVAFGTKEAGHVAELVALIDDAIVGCVALSDRGNRVAYLSKLFVDEHARGRGIGRALLLAAHDEATRLGFVEIRLQTRSIFTAACALYEANGWTRGEDPSPIRGPDRTYVRRL